MINSDCRDDKFPLSYKSLQPQINNQCRSKPKYTQKSPINDPFLFHKKNDKITFDLSIEYVCVFLCVFVQRDRFYFDE